jgi:Uma2 family endonuclease
MRTILTMADPVAPVLDRISQAPPDPDALYEVVDGELREVPYMGVIGGTLTSVLVGYLNTFALSRRLGLAVMEVLFQLRTGWPQRRPDLAFVPYDRWPGLAVPYADPAALEVVPSLATEVISKTNTAEEFEDKIQEYFDSGVQLVWVIFPRHRRIHVYESPRESKILTEADDLEGGAAVPGFRLSVRDLFAALVKPS